MFLPRRAFYHFDIHLFSNIILKSRSLKNCCKKFTTTLSPWSTRTCRTNKENIDRIYKFWNLNNQTYRPAASHE